jgi:hypothetical protein
MKPCPRLPSISESSTCLRSSVGQLLRTSQSNSMRIAAKCSLAVGSAVVAYSASI